MDEVIRIEHLDFSYHDGHRVLQDINLDIKYGESIALIGPNGAGKSTLLLHLNGILRSNGSVKIFGQTINDRNLWEVRRRVGLVFHDPDDQLFCPTVFDDVAFGPLNMGYPEAKVKQAVSRALAAVGMTGLERRPPHHLSVGEKKRVALAAVLAMEPALLVFDEPTSSLDPRSKWSFIELLKKLSATKVIATHDLQLVSALCHRVLVLDEGRIVADGPVAVVLSDQQLLEAHGLAPAPIKA